MHRVRLPFSTWLFIAALIGVLAMGEIALSISSRVFTTLDMVQRSKE